MKSAKGSTTASRTQAAAQRAVRRLGREQHGEHAHGHRGRHDQVTPLPGLVLVGRCVGDLGARRDPQHAGAGPDHGQAVAALVGGSQGRLALGARRFNAKRIQCDVLGGRGESDDQRAHHHSLQLQLRVVNRHAHDPTSNHDLRQQQPAAAAA
jgi:hypothetical protein